MRGESHGPHEEHAEQDIWSFFDAYRTSGSGAVPARPEIDSFRHIAAETTVKDRLLLAERKNKPHLRRQRERGPDAFTFENFLVAEAMRNRWLGGEMSPTSEYDDWVSGADAVVEWEAEDGPVRLAVDFTSTDKLEVFFKKSGKLEGNVQIKYLRSRLVGSGSDAQDMRASMPIVILGADDRIFQHIAEARQPMGQDHPLRLLLLEQANTQIKLQMELLEEKLGSVQRRTGRESKQQVSPKHRNRFQDLERVGRQLEAQLSNARQVPFDDDWEKLLAASPTHQILFGRR